jgi:hypothetical protein
MVFVKQTLPSRQVGLTHLPNIYQKLTIWKQPTIPTEVKTKMEKLKEEKQKKEIHPLLRQNMQVYEANHQMHQLMSARGLNPGLVQHRYR